MNKTSTVYISITLLLIIILVIYYHFCPLLNSIPLPTGTFLVGYARIHIKDDSTNNLNSSTFSVDVFYPTNFTAVKKPYPYQPEKIKELKKIKTEGSWIPSFVWSYLLSNIYTYAIPNAPLVTDKNKYPIIVYLPGIGGDDLHNVYLEELASYGYIIFAIEPSGDISVSLRKDNSAIHLNKFLKEAIEKNNREEIYAYRNQAHERWNNYLNCTIKELRHLNKNVESMFFKRLDLNAIGFLGHSHGGAVVTDFCQQNSICKAGVNMDGWTKTYNTTQHFHTPFLFLLNEEGQMPEMQELFNNNQRDTFKKVIIPGAGHLAFNDYILIKQPIAGLLGVAKGDSSMIRQQISKNIVSFFDKYLKAALKN